MTDDVKHVLIYTDGACDPNPGGPGGYGILLIYNEKRKEISGGFRSTTSNRMEVYAAIKALESLKEPCRVTLHSDSKYLVRAMSKGWAQRWKDKDWWRNERDRAINADLWDKLLSLCTTHQVKFVWVQGHAENPENERCDHLAVDALKQKNLPPDEGYENRSEEEKTGARITREGQACRKCSTPVIKRIPRKPKKTQAYYFEYYFYCPKCGTMYLVEEAKRNIDSDFAAQLEIVKEGQPCRKCSTPVIKRISKKHKPFLYCPMCHASYEIKNNVSGEQESLTLL